jgi:hypothetical protein
MSLDRKVETVSKTYAEQLGHFPELGDSGPALCRNVCFVFFCGARSPPSYHRLRLEV